jgi:hypothetical protein
MKLMIGSHRLHGTDGRVTVRGKSQIALEWGYYDRRLQLTMDLYGSEGRHVARLRRNRWTFNDRNRFEFSGSGSGFHLVDTTLGAIVLRARVVGRDAVAITHGEFFSAAGDAIEVATEDWGRATGSTEHDLPASRPTNPYFGADEVVTIIAALAASTESVDCPRCGCPLTRERLDGVAEGARCLVSCMICHRNLVVDGRT